MGYMPANPPIIFDGVYPYTLLNQSYTYRRTVALVKTAAAPTVQRDYVVLVDASNASDLATPSASCVSFQFFQQDGQVLTQLSPNTLDVGNGTLSVFASDGASLLPVAFSVDRWNWTSEGNENATRVQACAGPAARTYASILYPDGSTMPAVQPATAAARGLRGSAAGGSTTPTVTAAAGGDGSMTLTVAWASGAVDALVAADMAVNATAEMPAGSAAAVLLSLARNGGTAMAVLIGSDVDLDRPQVGACRDAFGCTPPRYHTIPPFHGSLCRVT